MNVTLLVVAVVVIAIVAFAAWFFNRQRRRTELRQQFGPEYDRAVETYGERGRAENALSARAERVAALHIRALPAEESARYAEQWRSVQSNFVDDPEHAIGDADRLCGQVMQARVRRNTFDIGGHDFPYFHNYLPQMNKGYAALCVF